MNDLRRIAVLNRGEPAVRFIRALREYNLASIPPGSPPLQVVAFYTDPDDGAPFVRMADDAVALGPPLLPGPSGANISAYCHHDHVLALLQEHDCDAVWPGWGFASEDPTFVDRLDQAGITFIGPPAEAMRRLGDKIASKQLAEAAGVPLAPWRIIDPDADPDTLRAAADAVGFPLMVKASAGGGGRGIRRVDHPELLVPAIRAAADEVRRVFGQGGIFLERCVERARHIEVQLLANHHGRAFAVGIRDCSIQRRNQKVIEEAPSPILPAEMATLLQDASVRLAELAGYRSAGTAEFLYDPASNQACFLEVNARLQVEHTITEVTTGIDLVHAQLDVARQITWEPPDTTPRGCAIEVRLNAENPEEGFAPSPGLVRLLRTPAGPGVRVDSGIAEGMAVPPDFDSMIAKVIAWAPTRPLAIARLTRALQELEVVLEDGATNKAFLLALLQHPAYVEATAHTAWIDGAIQSGAFAKPQGEFEALVTASIIAWRLQRHADIQRFFAQAQNGIPQQLPAPRGSTHELRLRGRTFEMELREKGEESYLVGLPGALHAVSIEPLGPHAATLFIQGRRHQILYAWGRTGIAVEVDGAMHHIERASGGTVRAPAPAMVVHVHVQPGQRVQIGDRLCTLEAMKMETAVFAQEPGIVREVLVSANQQVTAGQPLALLEPEVADGDAAPQAPPELPRPLTSPTDRLLLEGPALLDAMSPQEAAQTVADLQATFASVLLGYDAPAGLLAALEPLLEHVADLQHPRRWLPLLDLLEVAADIARVFAADPPDDTDDPHARSTLAAFFDFARQHHEGEDAASAPFAALLLRALAPYELRSLEPNDALRAALWRLAVTRAWPEERRALTSLLLRLAMHLQSAGIDLSGRDGLRTTLERIAALHLDAPSSPVADNARQARYLIFERPRAAARQRQLDAWVDDLLDRVRRDDADAEAIEALAAAHHPLLPTLLRSPDLQGGLAFAEVLLYRLYIGRALRRVEGQRQGDLRWTTFRVEVGQHPLHVTLVESPALQWRDALQALPALAQPGRVELALHGPPPGDLADDLLRAALHLQLPAGVTHLTASWCEPGGALRHHTWRCDGGALTENPVLRDIHPEVARRLELRRLEGFELERLTASEYIYAFRARARTNARDERIFVFAELRYVPDTPSAGGGEELVEFKRLYNEALAVLRAAQARDGKRLHWNRLTLFVRPTLHLNAQGVELLARRFTPTALGLGLEKVVLRARVFRDEAPDGTAEVEYVVRLRNRAQIEVVERTPDRTPIDAVSSYDARVVTARRLGCAYPFEVVRMLEGRSQGEALPDGIAGGTFVEHDLALDGERLVPIQRPYGQNTCGVVVGLVTHRTAKLPEGMTRVWIASDPTVAMGALAEPECRRILAAIDLADALHLPVEWLPISSGARIAMDSGTENLDWTARVLRRIIEFTQQSGEINIIVDGINVGAQSYWNAEATMLMHTRGLLIMTPRGSMVLTGRKALEFSGGVAAEDERGIGGLERVMGPNGQAQIAARDLAEAYAILFAHYRFTYRPQGEPGPRRHTTADPDDRSVLTSPYEARFGETFATVGQLFDRATNPDRKLPFAIREVMRAVIDHDGGHLERFAAMRHAEMAVVWDAHLGGQPACVVGIESRPIPRHGRVPMDGPDTWTGGTLFPQSSRKVARALNAASGNRPAVVLANLSGFDGSPESLRRLQLEYGAEIGRAVVNFQGPLIFVVVGRYHGGAYVVFSRALNPRLRSLALEGSFASVIGGAPAAAVVFPRDVQRRVDRDPRLLAARQALQAAPEDLRPALRDKLDKLAALLLLEKRGEVAREFDAVHTVERAVQVGSLDAVIAPERLRPAIIDLLRSSDAWGHLPATPEPDPVQPPEPLWPSSDSAAPLLLDA